LHSINWFRIVIDEADNIKNKNTKNSKSVIELNGVMKWVLTGTPIQNKIEDMYPYLSFLNFEPFDNYQFFKFTIDTYIEKQPEVG